MTFSQARKKLPSDIASSIDWMSVKTLDDLYFYVLNEVDTYEGGFSDCPVIESRASYRKAKKLLSDIIKS